MTDEPFCWCCIKPGREVMHPWKLRVYRVPRDPTHDAWPADDTPWHWSVWRYEDRLGGRVHSVTRWGDTSRWEDAFDAGMAALARELGYEPVILGRAPGGPSVGDVICVDEGVIEGEGVILPRDERKFWGGGG